jgi:hypothetical protein
MTALRDIINHCGERIKLLEALGQLAAEMDNTAFNLHLHPLTMIIEHFELDAREEQIITDAFIGRNQ